MPKYSDGIVKIPRVPVSDDSMRGELPTYRNIWNLIRDHLPKKGRSKKESEPSTPEPKLPKELEGALRTLYGNYEKQYHQWLENTDAQSKGLTPPVFILVCNNTSVSKMVYDYISGWDTGKVYPNNRPVLAPGQLTLFNNVKDGNWTARPNTILVDSKQLESGEAMSDEFKKLAAREIEEFKADYRERYPGQDPDKITNEELLREVLNTVGKSGKLGEHIRCVVSVSMLTEGWDANTVTHILGVRAFGTQLLCEQVVGRGLRRISYTPTANQINVNGKSIEIESFTPEYAEVYGVPFAFIPCAGSNKQPKRGVLPTRVRAIPERTSKEITFPRLLGYRYEIKSQKLTPDFNKPGCKYSLSTDNLPTKTENAPIIGKSSIHTLDDLKARREQEVAFLLAKLTLEKYFRQDGTQKQEKLENYSLDDSEVQVWLFPQVLQIAKQWIKECVTYKSATYSQLLLLNEFAHDASDCIYQAIVAGEKEKSLKPILRPYDPMGSTRYVDFSTARPTYLTDLHKCHISHVVADTNSWEQKMAQVLEAKEAVQGISYDLLIVCGFAFDPGVSEESKRYGKLQVLVTKMNPDLLLGDEVLKKTGSGNLFMVFGEPDIEVQHLDDGRITVELKGLDIYDPTTGEIHSSSVKDIACWFIDTNYNGESFFVRHAYFTGANKPYEKLKKTLKAEIDEDAWLDLYSDTSRPFDSPQSKNGKPGKIAVKVINHYGDEILKVYQV
ncbi:MAG: hypothetical protein SWZ49_13750 [Cyanobacteriota bacterium]|nr:hypothetical protein [Cyanobacteriota bacterium]